MSDNVVKGPWAKDPRAREIKENLEAIQEALNQAASAESVYETTVAINSCRIRSHAERIWDLWQEQAKDKLESDD